MAIYDSAVVIAALPDRIFPYFTEPERLKQWVGGLIETVPLTDEGPRVGAKSREVVEENGRRMVFESEILHLHPNRLLEVELRGDALEAVSRYELKGIDDGTRVSHAMHVAYNGLFMKLLSPFIRRAVQRKLAADFVRLKEVVEKRR
jgi:uncharacterized protein YndB with AHSA1/START domain